MKPMAFLRSLILSCIFALAAHAQENTLDIRIEHAQHAAAIDPLLLTAWQAYRAGDLDTAAQRYGEVLHNDAQNHNPPSRDALLGMAAIARQRSQDTAAARYYAELLALDPRDPDAHAGLSSPPDAADEGAESRLKLLLTQYPRAAALHFALGGIYARQSRWGEARQAYTEALALEPDSSPLAFNLAVSLDHLGQHPAAAGYYQRALQQDDPTKAGIDRMQLEMRLVELQQQSGP